MDSSKFDSYTFTEFFYYHYKYYFNNKYYIVIINKIKICKKFFIDS